MKILQITAAFIVFTGITSAKVIYVDSTISGSSTASYNTGTRSSSGGADTAYKSFAGAVAAAVPGDMVSIRGGTYNEALSPASGVSGTASQYITYKNYNGEFVIITGNLTPGIDITNRSYIVIDGLKVQTVVRWLYALNAHYNIIRNNTFTNATDAGGSSKTGLCFQLATYNKIINNYIEGSTMDNLSFISADRNLVEGNIIKKAAHNIWVIHAGDFNVMRNNYFHNEDQKIGSILDSEAMGFDPKITSFNSTTHNLIEKNDFGFTPGRPDRSPWYGIQFCAQQTIIRYNRFYDCAGGALGFSLYDNEARYNTDNRIYNNVFYHADHASLDISTGATGYFLSGNIFKNNIATGSKFVTHDTRWPWYNAELHGKNIEIITGRLDGFFFLNNVFYGGASSNPNFLITYGDRDTSSAPTVQHPLAWYETNYPLLFSKNKEVNPLFVNAAGHDFNLSSTSTLINTGEFMAKTAGSGNGTSMAVDDARYFYDGYGIPGEVGDLIQLEGQTQTAVITGINYTTNTLTINQPLSWTSGLGVHLAYAGSAPDIGAYEYGLAPTTTASAPSETRIQVYPNPIIFNGGNTVKLANVLASSEVSIYSFTGELIKTIMSTGATTEWDGRDNNGNKVSRGVYLAINKGAVIRKGRIAVIY